MRGTRFLIPPAVVLLASLTAASAQTNAPDLRRSAIERSAVQDGVISEQEVRERADILRQDERDPATTGSIRPPTTSGSGQRTVTGPARRRILE